MLYLFAAEPPMPAGWENRSHNPEPSISGAPPSLEEINELNHIIDMQETLRKHSEALIRRLSDTSAQMIDALTSSLAALKNPDGTPVDVTQPTTVLNRYKDALETLTGSIPTE